jgi:N-acetylglutamate synthase-like GNAT family acetyltransferase
MIRPALPTDVEGINQLMEQVGFLPIEESFLKDVAFVGLRDQKVTGFIWGSVSRSKHLGVIDYLAVDPKAKGDGFRLCRAIVKRFHRIGVKKVLSHVSYQEEFKTAFKIAVKIGLRPLPDLYTLLVGDCERMSQLWAE